MTKHRDLWDRIEWGIRVRGRENFRVRKVMGHADAASCGLDERLWEEKRRNDKADELATGKAEECVDDEGRRVREEQRQRRRMIGKVQEIMIQIMQERYKEVDRREKGEEVEEEWTKEEAATATATAPAGAARGAAGRVGMRRLGLATAGWVTRVRWIMTGGKNGWGRSTTNKHGKTQGTKKKRRER